MHYFQDEKARPQSLPFSLLIDVRGTTYKIHSTTERTRHTAQNRFEYVTVTGCLRFHQELHDNPCFRHDHVLKIHNDTLLPA